MTSIILSRDVSRQLTSVQRCVALCDEAGVTIGFFTPATPAPNLGPRVSDEEMDRRAREEPTNSTDEVLAHLRTL